jgi:hypothetical protein
MPDPAKHERKPTQKTQPKKGEPIVSNQRAAFAKAKRLAATAESHERRVALREDSARFLDERGETAGAEHERREAELERDAARDAWDRAQTLEGPTQLTDGGLEIPIPSRDDFLRSIEKVAPKRTRPERDKEPPLERRRR